MPDSGRPFSKVNDIRSHECVPISRLRVVGFCSWNRRRGTVYIMQIRERNEEGIAYCNPRNPRKRKRLLAVYPIRGSFKPFHSAVSEGSHVTVGISSKANDRENICLQTLFLFLALPQTPCFPPRAPCFPLDPVFSTRPCVFQQTPCYPPPTFFTPQVFKTPCNPFPWSRVFHPAETALISSAVLHKLLVRLRPCYFVWYVQVN